MKRCIVILALVCAITCTPALSRAEGLAPIFTMPLLGASFGSMIGLIAFTYSDDPDEHYDYVAMGAGIGAAAGLVLGVAEVVGPQAGFYRRDTGHDTLYGFTITFPLQ